MRCEWHIDTEGYGYVTLYRETADPKFYGIRYANGEKRLFNYLKKHLNAHGNHFMRTTAQHDGHMMGDQYQPIIRPTLASRKLKSPGLQVIIYSGFYAVHGANEEFNQGEVRLNVDPAWKD